MIVDCTCGGNNPNCSFCEGRGYYHKKKDIARSPRKKMNKAEKERMKSRAERSKHIQVKQLDLQYKEKEKEKEQQKIEARLSQRESEWDRIEAHIKSRKEARDSKKPFKAFFADNKGATELNNKKKQKKNSSWQKRLTKQKKQESQHGNSIGDNAIVTSYVLRKPSQPSNKTESISKKQQDYLDKIKKRLKH